MKNTIPTESPTGGYVYFIGAGPGDPELLTLKAQRLIAAADVILYAGSLVNPDVLRYARPDAEVYNTASMPLPEQVTLMTQAAAQGKLVARLHTGDPAIFGAIAEQMAALDEAGTRYAIVPGVSSAFAAAAALGIEYTLPQGTQTLILTRLGGKTPVPASEALSSLASHRASMAIFLSTGMIAEVVDALQVAGYPADTPVAVVFRVSWPDERIIRGTLADITKRVQEAEITHQGLIIVSPALSYSKAANRPTSHLYSTAQEPVQRVPTTAIISLTRNGTAIGRRLLEALPGSVFYAPHRFLNEDDKNREGVRPYAVAVRQVLQEAFQAHSALICIMATGIVVRELAPFLRGKHSDPAVVVIDEMGRYAVSLLSGHLGGANALAYRVAEALGGTAVITTASDGQGTLALDLLGAAWGWRIEHMEDLTAASAALVNGDPVGVWQEAGETIWWPDPPPANLRRYATLAELLAARPAAALLITPRRLPEAVFEALPTIVLYRPPCLVVGVGCNRNTPAAEITAAIDETLASAGFASAAVRCVVTVEDKRDEPGLRAACTKRGWPLRFLSRERLATMSNLPNPSQAAQKALGVLGVAEPAALIAAGARELLIEKRRFANVTVAVALATPEAMP
ncbi:MAG: precorrin-4 C(11)-methyltransferase [Anaerolineae bacterium]|nr:precorrin-4 C(11)-methyltransferase [Anaerolineae bacterium]MDW8100933.1 precorrin-4 C(11)-methyltransferase [Anaerolineae bacterium]